MQALAGGSEPRSLSWSRVAHFASIVFLGVLPAVTIVVLFVGVVRDDSVALDLLPR
jgi:hypothetical protein